MDFQDYYNNFLRQQTKTANEVSDSQGGTPHDENECDSYSTNTITNFNTKPNHINNPNYNSNSFAMQDESTLKTGFVSTIGNHNLNNKGSIGFTSNPLKHKQKQLEINNQRCFGRELGNVEQERHQTSQNYQNNTKVPLTQNYVKPLGYTQLQQQRGGQEEVEAQSSSASSQQNPNMKRNMSVEYMNNPNENLSQKVNENNFYSRNSIPTHNQMQDENQQKMNINSNSSKQKENYKSERYSSGMTSSMQQNYNPGRSHSRNTMDVEQSQGIYSFKERNSLLEYTFPKDKLQKDPMYQHVRSIFDYLRTTENQYTAKGTMSSIQNEINVRMRAIMVDWLVDVHLKFKLIPETLYLTINLIDRFIEKKSINKDRLQLLGATSMFIACKFEEIYPPEINDFVFICDSLYTKENILQMEGDIIITVNFDLTFTSPLRFLERYCYLNESTEVQYFCAQYLLELALIEYTMVEYSPSNQAASALYLVNKIFELNQPWGEELRLQSQYDQIQLKKCAKDLWQLLQKANEFQYKYQKQVADVENQEQIQIAQLQQWYKNEKATLQSQPFDQDLAEELEIDFDSKRKQIEIKIKEIKSSLLCNNKNLVAIIRKFSLPKFSETAKLLFSIQHP